MRLRDPKRCRRWFKIEYMKRPEETIPEVDRIITMTPGFRVSRHTFLTRTNPPNSAINMSSDRSFAHLLLPPPPKDIVKNCKNPHL